jgi:bifunctional ADP-heptose synthase (sugar kinase/adenylyltransferase)
MKILIIGDSCTDKFIYGECKAFVLKPLYQFLAPVGFKDNPGMAKNVFNNFLSINKGKL